jgi:hypothetical protein
MTRPLILSERLSRVSDGPQRSFFCRLARTPSPAGSRYATGRGGDARNAAGHLPALWPAQLPLRQRPRPWSKALSFGQPAQRPTSQRLRPQRRCRARQSMHRQLEQGAQCARSNLRNQHRTFAAPRGSRIDRHGYLARSPRFSAGGCNIGRYGGSLSRRFIAARCRGDVR